MKRWVVVIALLCTAADAAPARWSAGALAELRAAVAAADDDALPRPALAQLDAAERAGAPAVIDAAADAAALKLARLHLLGSAGPAQRTGWRIVDGDTAIDPAPQLARAVASGQVAGFFTALRPAHPDYAGLRAAYAAERNPAGRKTIARNMERWRWMPRDLGSDYILVNAASFEARLWRSGQPIRTWRVIVGKPRTATPVFSAAVTGVTLNPWWDVPASIVRESVGALVRRSPATARARGYVWSGGHIRQRPGPNNSLGEMKLAMANPWNVYLHDTPNRKLFDEPVRAFSHGCVRVGDALGLAQVLLEGVRTRPQIDARVATRQTETVALPRPVPVYITYFTAGLRGDGTFAYFPDIYGRDARLTLAPQVNDACGV